MTQLWRIVVARFARNPLKASVFVGSFSLNSAVLTLALTVSLAFNGYLEKSLLRPGTAVWITTYSTDDPGATKQQVQLFTSWLPTLKKEADLRFASPFVQMLWDGISVGASSYRLTSGCLGVHPDYAAMCDLRIAVGSFLSDQDVADHRKVAVVSENVARAIWGSSEAAIGAQFSSVGGRFVFDRASVYQVIGVFFEPGELQRRFYYIPGAFVPYEYISALNFGGPYLGSLVNSLRVQSDDPNLSRVRNRILAAIKLIYRDANREFDPEIELPIWEGSYRDRTDNADAALLARIRMVSAFFGLIWVFALLVLVFGILSLFSSDVSARLRETGLRRALGSTRGRVMGLIAGEAVAIVLLANFSGVVLALAFSGSLLEALKPLLAGGGLVEEVIISRGSLAPALFISLGASVAAGVLGSLYPAFTATRMSASDALRELR